MDNGSTDEEPAADGDPCTLEQLSLMESIRTTEPLSMYHMQVCTSTVLGVGKKSGMVRPPVTSAQALSARYTAAAQARWCAQQQPAAIVIHG